MYNSQHSGFILSPLSDIISECISACKGVGYKMESYPLSDYVMQSLFLKLTGAQEQKLKCICWELATVDYEYRYELLNNKHYGECSDYDSKRDIYNDLISAIQIFDSSFSPDLLIDNSFLNHVLSDLQSLYKTSCFSVWQNKELLFYERHYSNIMNDKQIGQPKQRRAKVYPLFESVLKNHYIELVYKHRNRCAHNTLSYQINKPDLAKIAEPDYEYHTYFFRFAIIILIDDIFIALSKKYYELLRERI